MAKRPEAATERQNKYATALGITSDPAISKAELGALIDAHIEKHGKPIPQHFQRWLADGGYRIPRGQGFDNFVNALSPTDRDVLLCELFAYRIIERLHTQHSRDIGSDPSQRAVLRGLARDLAKESRSITSIRRFTLKQLVWNQFSGDTRLVGYIEAANLIHDRFGIGQAIVETKRSSAKDKGKSGCLGMVLAMVSVAMSLLILALSGANRN